MKRLPFAKAPKTEIVPVGTEETGILYLLKRNARTVSERSQLDEVELKQSKGQLILFKLARRIAEEKGISNDEALALILGGSSSPILLEYLDEMQELVALRTESDKFKELVATVMISHRIARPITVISNAKSNSVKLSCAPLSLHLNDGDLIKFEACKVTVVGNHEPGVEEIAIASLNANIAAQKVGFLCNFESGTPSLGDPDWLSDDTKELDETLIDALYEFYQLEVSGGVKAQGYSEGNGQMPLMSPSDNLKNSVVEIPSTGENSTGESLPTEPRMTDLAA